MKLITLFLFVAMVQLSAATYSQTTRLKVAGQNLTLGQIFESIEKQSEFSFFYNVNQIDLTRKVDINADNQLANKILDDVLSGTGMTYTINNKLIIIHKDGEVVSMASAQQQGKTVTGKVTDQSGGSLPGVSVIVKGTTIGVVTEANGGYTLSNIPENATLQFSFVGMKTQEVAVGNKKTVTVAMEEETVGIEEIIAVGYGIQKKTTMTGSVSTLKGEAVAATPVANISQSIAGKMAGVSMRPNGGQPGSDSPDIHIRGIATTGNNAPLIVIDGIIRANINQIDPNTIESISVLKDASAVAPYGLGGANGVILITTKKGKTGAPTLTFDTYYGIQAPTYNYYPELLDAKGYMSLRNEAYLNDYLGKIPAGSQLPFDQAMISDYDNLHAKDPDKYPNSNPSEYVKLTAPVQNYNLQISGGSEKIKYFAGLGFFKQKAMFDPMNYGRYNYNMNLETQVTNTTKVVLALIGSIENTNTVDPAESASGLFRSGYKFIPIKSIYYSTGQWGEFAGRSPVGVLNSGGYVKNDNNTLLTSISIEQQMPFVKGLSVKANFSYDPNQRTIKSWHRPFYFSSQNLNTTPYSYATEISANEGGSPSYTWLSQEYSKNQVFTFQGFVNYHNTFGKHDITGLLVAESRNNKYEIFNARRDNYAINIDELGMGSSSKTDFSNDGSSATGSQIGYVYRFGYTYGGKYMAEASGRYDGHYYFAPGKRWAYFPAFSLGWRVSQEDFMKKYSFIENLKLRASWGKSGNLAGSAYQYLSGYNLAGNAYAFGTGNMVQGSSISTEANPNITWEIATKSDVGLDATLWKGLLTIEADYFHERRTGMLLAPAVKVPVEYGLSLSQENAGIMESHGFEFVTGSNYKLKNGVVLGITGNFSYATNKMVQIFETAATRNNPNRSRTGRAFGAPFGYHALGLFTTAEDKNNDGIINATDGYTIAQFGELHPGDIKYADLSGPAGIPDGKIDANDETAIGHPVYPLISYGFTPTATWKGFDASLFFQGSALVSLSINSTFQTLPFANNSSNTTNEYMNNRWTPTNQGAKYPRATQAPYTNNTQGSDFWMMGTGFLRLKTAILGYTIPSNITKAMKIQSVRVYCSAQNIFTLSKLKFMDPEIGYTDKETAYPNQKVTTFGINVTF
ncbi:MAG: TonB-dependent receptor [Mariniphaga sp.]